MTAELHVIDVGHGNCAVVTGVDWTLMVDAGASAAVIQTIEYLGLDRLDAIAISHRDLDHARGLVPLLSRRDLEIGAIYVGADAAKNPSAPETANLLVALADAKRNGRCLVSRDLDDTFNSETLSGGGVSVEVLAPSFELAMTGPKGKSSTGSTISSNSVSAVLRVTLSNGRRVLLPGDLDGVGLAELLGRGADLSADVLVFPHHGSLSTVADERAFAAEVVEAVGASTVLFSVGRSAKARPTEEVMRGVFDANPKAEIACTQMSSGCLEADAELPDRLAHLTKLPAAGRAGCRSCAGSMTIGDLGIEGPNVATYQEYIGVVAKTPMCRTVRP
ncbi:MAG TPA: MBL fold metallo-hydrolase [Solirubrobacteraceae bacterium]|nr:MBL fold metallo-hydrolase [Solirubrobacteraceae bacterium]